MQGAFLLLTEGLDELSRKRAVSTAVKTSIYDAVVPFLKEPPVWGSLTGVRPAKLARGLVERGKTRGEAAEILRSSFHVSPERTALTIRAAATAMELDKEIGPDDVSLYVGIPFCPSRCYYCSFVSSTTAQSGALIEPYLETLCGEIRETAALVRQAGKRVQSIYIGGGTPTTLSAEQLERLTAALADSFDLSALREYTVEAGRPDTITPEKLRVLKNAGVGRVSINPQSMEDSVLAAIGRKHAAADVLRAFDEAAAAGRLPRDQHGRHRRTDRRHARDLCAYHRHAHRARPGEYHGPHPRHQARRGPHRQGGGRRTARDGLAHAGLRLSCAAAGRLPPPSLSSTARNSWRAATSNVGWCRPGTECFYNVTMMEELQTILSLGAGGVSKRVDRDTGWIERANNPKYPLEYIRAADRLANGKKKLLFSKK